MSDLRKHAVSKLALECTAKAERIFNKPAAGGDGQRRAKVQVMLRDAILALLDSPAEPPQIPFAQIRGYIAQFNEDALLADGFENAFIGVAERCGQPTLVVYDAKKCVEILMKRDGMEYEEAYEFFHFNTLGAWVGEHTPLFLWQPDPDQPVEAFTDTPK